MKYAIVLLLRGKPLSPKRLHFVFSNSLQRTISLQLLAHTLSLNWLSILIDISALILFSFLLANTSIASKFSYHLFAVSLLVLIGYTTTTTKP